MKTALAETRKIKYIATVNDEALLESTDPDWEMEYIDIGNVEAGAGITGTATYRFEDAPSRARRRVRNGDVIVSTVRTYLQAIAAIIDPPPNLIVSTGFAVIRPVRDRLDPGYCRYALREPSFLAEVERRSVGVSYPAVNASELAAIHIPFPTLPRQRAIAAYLDRETAKIDAMIAAKERLLALLAEKRRALITHAVTRGLNLNAPMKDSGIEWLGQIPEHWEITKFSWDVFIVEGQVDPEELPYRDMTLVAPNHIEAGTGRFLGTETAAEQAAISGKYLCEAGDVIYSKIRPALRKVILAEDRCLCSADMYPLRPSERILAQYLACFLLGDRFSMWATLESQRVAMPKINREALTAIRIPVPPRVEQKAIVDAIATACRQCDLLRNVAEGSLRLLSERRSALIAAAVTGQLDVEDAA